MAEEEHHRPIIPKKDGCALKKGGDNPTAMLASKKRRKIDYLKLLAVGLLLLYWFWLRKILILPLDLGKSCLGLISDLLLWIQKNANESKRNLKQFLQKFLARSRKIFKEICDALEKIKIGLTNSIFIYSSYCARFAEAITYHLQAKIYSLQISFSRHRHFSHAANLYLKQKIANFLLYLLKLSEDIKISFRNKYNFCFNRAKFFVQGMINHGIILAKAVCSAFRSCFYHLFPKRSPHIKNDPQYVDKRRKILKCRAQVKRHIRRQKAKTLAKVNRRINEMLANYDLDKLGISKECWSEAEVYSFDYKRIRDLLIPNLAAMHVKLERYLEPKSHFETAPKRSSNFVEYIFEQAWAELSSTIKFSYFELLSFLRALTALKKESSYIFTKSDKKAKLLRAIREAIEKNCRDEAMADDAKQDNFRDISYILENSKEIFSRAMRTFQKKAYETITGQDLSAIKTSTDCLIAYDLLHKLRRYADKESYDLAIEALRVRENIIDKHYPGRLIRNLRNIVPVIEFIASTVYTIMLAVCAVLWVLNLSCPPLFAACTILGYLLLIPTFIRFVYPIISSVIKEIIWHRPKTRMELLKGILLIVICLALILTGMVGLNLFIIAGINAFITIGNFVSNCLNSVQFLNGLWQGISTAKDALLYLYDLAANGPTYLKNLICTFKGEEGTLKNIREFSNSNRILKSISELGDERIYNEDIEFSFKEKDLLREISSDPEISDAEKKQFIAGYRELFKIYLEKKGLKKAELKLTNELKKFLNEYSKSAKNNKKCLANLLNIFQTRLEIIAGKFKNPHNYHNFFTSRNDKKGFQIEMKDINLNQGSENQEPKLKP